MLYFAYENKTFRFFIVKYMFFRVRYVFSNYFFKTDNILRMPCIFNRDSMLQGNVSNGVTALSILAQVL